jgi:hypothetical protein
MDWLHIGQFLYGNRSESPQELQVGIVNRDLLLAEILSSRSSGIKKETLKMGIGSSRRCSSNDGS